jgi:hypothetical protein
VSCPSFPASWEKELYVPSRRGASQRRGPVAVVRAAVLAGLEHPPAAAQRPTSTISEGHGAVRRDEAREGPDGGAHALAAVADEEEERRNVSPSTGIRTSAPETGRADLTSENQETPRLARSRP